jgi:hypothetical protein
MMQIYEPIIINIVDCEYKRWPSLESSFWDVLLEKR